ncbi:MAG TPA: metal ABC transporter permease [Candidatus Latescibacteria bacterium]|nr:metal ABC transporter permease [Candidatus Latescibacterota bacterium]
MVELLQFEFLRNALIAGVLASVVCGIIGPYVVVNRIVFISGGISHAAFGGIGLGYILGINPIWGAISFALASALGMGLVVKRTRLPEDTVIGILWAGGMALGVIFIGLSPGYAPDLFGNILTVPYSDIILMLALCSIVISVVFLLYKEFLATSFDEEFATVVGVPVRSMYLVLLCLIALTVVVLIRIVGIVLVIALLTIPAAISRQFTRNLKRMMLLSVVLGVIFTFCGLWLSVVLDIASGATIILVSAASFLICSLKGWLRRRR